MKGIHKVVVYTKFLHYEFELRHNITIIRGNSATGKTTLVDMIQEHINNPSGSPVNLICDKECYVLSGALWKEQLEGIRDGIVFIDEGNEFIITTEFARRIQATDNYYVIVTRESLPSLPYSIEETYGIRISGKYGSLKQHYHEFYQIYGMDVYRENVKPELIVTEDSNAGYQFFESICKENGLKCISAGGKSNVFQVISTHIEERLLVIADGAACGSEIDRTLQIIKDYDHIAVYLPESFEWLILSSDILKENEVKEILAAPSDYIDSEKYFSWERYFTALLVRKTKDSWLAYSKASINKAYLNDRVRSEILKQMRRIALDRILSDKAGKAG